MTKPVQQQAHTVEEMLAMGKAAAAQAHAGSVWILSGELGAGKTHWTKGFVEGIGSPANVTSPTFGLVHEYHGGRLPVYHFDFYRLNQVEELYAIGWDEYLESNGVLIAEWGNRFPDAFPPGSVQVHISVEADGSRRIEVRP